ncbi:MAG: photosystem II oxygen evolving complex protein PsbU [Oscillatoriales cyanobacterium SM2_1_8]|nr:photosystem II oxygen evolving complex protein PsbU [Oscillatoriales cyanobacterium SM2_1_8]
MKTLWMSFWTSLRQAATWLPMVGLAMALTLAIFPVGVVPAQAANLETLEETDFIKADNNKIDLNNANIASFRRLRGMYPTLAKILVQHAPYERVEDIFAIPELSDRQKTTLQSHVELFTLRRPDNALNRERINNASYRL